MALPKPPHTAITQRLEPYQKLHNTARDTGYQPGAHIAEDVHGRIKIYKPKTLKNQQTALHRYQY